MCAASVLSVIGLGSIAAKGFQIISSSMTSTASGFDYSEHVGDKFKLKNGKTVEINEDGTFSVSGKYNMQTYKLPDLNNVSNKNQLLNTLLKTSADKSQLVSSSSSAPGAEFFF